MMLFWEDILYLNKEKVLRNVKKFCRHVRVDDDVDDDLSFETLFLTVSSDHTSTGRLEMEEKQPSCCFQPA